MQYVIPLYGNVYQYQTSTLNFMNLILINYLKSVHIHDDLTIIGCDDYMYSLMSYD